MSRHLAPQVAQNMATCIRSALIFSGGALAFIAFEAHLGHSAPPDFRRDLKVILISSLLHHAHDAMR